ncbi:MAG: hypothetical protein NZ811_01955 [Gammaproteobacteria bacterium]|nr:hypothetical protein [Gammaproteobacteria bacterium]
MIDRTFIIRLIGKLDVLQKKKNNPSPLCKYLRRFEGDREELANIILEAVIKGVSNRETLVSIAECIGTKLLHLEGTKMSVLVFGGDYKKKRELIKVGVEAVGLMALAGCIRLAKPIKVDSKNEMYTLEPACDEFLKLVLTSDKSLGEFPTDHYTPWDKPWKGVNSIVKKMPVGWDEKYSKEAIPHVYEALNNYGSTPFSINNDLLKMSKDMMASDHCWIPELIPQETVTESLCDLIRLKNKEDFVGDKKAEWAMSVGIDNAFLNKLSKQMAKDWYTERSEPYIKTISAHSKRREFDMVLKKAEILSERSKSSLDKPFHFDFQLDSRGRFYPMQQWLEPTGSDYSKALLQFDNPQEWSENTEAHLAYHVANCAGMDKLSKQDRVNWVYDNYESIKEAVEDPLNSELLVRLQGEKKTKWQFLAGALSLVDLKENGREGWRCRIPVGLDATNSGLQILSFLTRDRKGCQDTNVIQHPVREIGDAYDEVWTVAVNNMYKMMDKFDEEEDEKEMDKNLVTAFQLNDYIEYGSRKVTKRPCMSYYYSAGEDCIRYQLYNDRGTFGSDVFSSMKFKDTRPLSRCIFKALDGKDGAYPPQANTLKVFQKTACDAVKNAEDVYLSWKTPTGFTAFQGYGQIHTERLRVRFGEKRIMITAAFGFKGVLKKRHKTGISANIVHSLDASLMTMVLSKLGRLGITDFMMIHDQFSVPASHVDTLFDEFKMIFIDTIGSGTLSSILEDLGSDDSDIIYGDVTDDEVLHANYIIS